VRESLKERRRLGIWQDGKFIVKLGDGQQIRKTLIAKSEPVCQHQTTNGYDPCSSFCRHSHYSCNLAMSLNQMAQRRIQWPPGGQHIGPAKARLASTHSSNRKRTQHTTRRSAELIFGAQHAFSGLAMPSGNK
jgi:hypothetical protein